MSERGPGGGRLSVVATPIGSLEDITLRALRILREADAVLAEDTRRTRTLCSHHGISASLRSFHAHSPAGRVEEMVQELREGAHLALVTDAGTPVVSDPGVQLVRAASDAGITVEAIPGPSAVTAALSVCGLRCDTFRFVGFLPRGGGRRRRILASLAADPDASVIFESPARLAATLGDLAEHLPAERELAVCRELTKVHEEVARGPASELASRFADGARGEITIVIGAGEAVAAEPTESEADLDERIRGWLADGLRPRDAAKRVAEGSSMSRSEAYRRVLEASGKADSPDREGPQG